MRRLLFLVVLFLGTCCRTGDPHWRTPLTSPAHEMSSSVQLVIQTDEMAMVLSADGGVNTTAKRATWLGSGTIYETQAAKTRFLSASHVLEHVDPGESITQLSNGDVVVKRVTISALAYSVYGASCPFKVLALGDHADGDVAVGEASCDLGPAANLGVEPLSGFKVISVSHPLGEPLPIVTDGYVSGTENNFLVTSTPIAPGSSGGGLFYDGKLVGVLVRVLEFDHVARSVRLETIKKRISEASEK